MNRIWCFLLLGTLGLSALVQAQQPQAAPTPQQRVAMLKQWLQASQQQLRTYEWVETTVIAKGGEEKKREQKSCYYGADGALQKVPLGSSAADSSGGPPGVLPLGRMAKRHAKHHQQEVADYMKSAAALIHSYIPPDPNRIQQSLSTGHMAINPVEPGRRTRLVFSDYLKAGDQLAVEIEVPTNRLLGMSVSSYLEDSRDDAVKVDVSMGVLADGTIYTEKTVLQAPAEDITVTVENTGYRHAGT